MQNSNHNFFRAANSIFVKTGVKRETHLLTPSLIDSFCVPVLLYGWDSIGNKKATFNSLDFVLFILDFVSLKKSWQ